MDYQALAERALFGEPPGQRETEEILDAPDDDLLPLLH
ncbi:MAG: biotin synthase BioB, partial [Candidatus Tectomicrobia bacterium]|nr:biotin synthase BioB [Candidatus Tectomicrobia bacterium]